MPTIRTYKQQDEQAVIELWTAVFGYPGPHNAPKLEIDRKLALQPDLLFVADLDGRVIGTVMAGYDGHRGWIYSLAVDENERGQGVGTALVRHAEAALAALGCPKVKLQVLAGNDAALAFYRKLGYSVEPHVALGKTLYGDGNGIRSER